jgi:hypothetical protein
MSKRHNTGCRRGAIKSAQTTSECSLLAVSLEVASVGFLLFFMRFVAAFMSFP